MLSKLQSLLCKLAVPQIADNSMGKAPDFVLREALTGLYVLDHPGELLPAWASIWVLPANTT